MQFVYTIKSQPTDGPGLFHCRWWCLECSPHAERDDYTAEY
jgi:hypothetical protein